jgi:hypothetical protein
MFVASIPITIAFIAQEPIGSSNRISVVDHVYFEGKVSQATA